MAKANVVFVLFLLAMFMVSCIHDTAPPIDRNAVSIRYDNGTITCSYAEHGLIEQISIQEIGLVVIATTNQGPAVNDWFLILEHWRERRGVVLPMDREETKPIFNTVLQFPGFNHKKFIEATGSTSNAYFVVWRK